MQCQKIRFLSKFVKTWVSQKGLVGFQKLLFLLWGFYESLKCLECWIRNGLFHWHSNLLKTVCLVSLQIQPRCDDPFDVFTTFYEIKTQYTTPFFIKIYRSQSVLCKSKNLIKIIASSKTFVPAQKTKFSEEKSSYVLTQNVLA